MPWVITAVIIGLAVGIGVGLWQYKQIVTIYKGPPIRDIHGNVLFSGERLVAEAPLVVTTLGILVGAIVIGILLLIFWAVGLL
jgi:hypothetical protein